MVARLFSGRSFIERFRQLGALNVDIVRSWVLKFTQAYSTCVYVPNLVQETPALLIVLLVHSNSGV